MDSLQRFALAFLKEFPNSPELMPIAMATLEGDNEKLTELLLQQVRGFLVVQRAWEQVEPMLIDVQEKSNQYQSVATATILQLRTELDELKKLKSPP